MADVLEQADSRLASVFSIHRYLGDVNTWDRTVTKLMQLPAEGVHHLGLDGRADVAASQIYGNPMLDWVLLVFNGIKRLGNLENTPSRRLFPFTVESNTSARIDVPLKFDTTTVLNADDVQVAKVLDGQGRLRADVDGDSVHDLAITFAGTGALIENISGLDISFSLVHEEVIQDDFMAAGHGLSFPSLRAVEAALQAVTAQSADQARGFGRL